MFIIESPRYLIMRSFRAIKEPTAVAWLDPAREWPGPRTRAVIAGVRRGAGGTRSERRAYLSSLPGDARRLVAAVRGHWGIEHRRHGALGVAFREDQRRVRIGHAAENLAVMRHVTLDQPCRGTTAKVGNATKRVMAGRPDASLLHLLAQSNAIAPPIPPRPSQTGHDQGIIGCSSAPHFGPLAHVA